VTEAEGIADRIQELLPAVKRGTLRFWGQWFGRPSDNVHSVVGCAAAGDRLEVRFDQKERLVVTRP